MSDTGPMSSRAQRGTFAAALKAPRYARGDSYDSPFSDSRYWPQSAAVLDSGEPAALCGIAFERYPYDAVAGIRPLFDHIKFSPTAPCADWSVVTERQLGNRVAKFYRQVH